MRKLSQNCRIIFLSTTLTAGMTGISLHMQRPLTSQSHGSILKENNFFCYGSNSTPFSGISLPS
jgi:hypothetical protein